MSPALWWLGRADLASATLSLGALLVGCFGTEVSPGRVGLRQRAARLDRALRLLRWRISGRDVLLLQAVAVVLVLTLAMGLHAWLVTTSAPVLLVLPELAVGHAVAKRTEKLSGQLEGWMLVLANALKGSASLGEAITSSVDLTSEPLRSEIALVVKEFSLGTPLDAALDNMALRVGTTTVSSTMLALRVARRTGGDLPRMLETSAETLRELARLEGVVRSRTAEGRAQTWVISCIPFAMIAAVERLRPGYFMPLTTNFVGHMLILVAALLWGGALLAARKILQVDI